ncbi:hypothetical protein [Amphritea balenae]|uniref:hypothetical protein n=1 Tax=Amphritea balenae TaxID=452629 RepID=UPI0014763195|nr:hypothetical protein [Amphritea balenae]GGK78281.1 hypothetical protein GCM10007941_30510 [Amphritea balenae]
MGINKLLRFTFSVMLLMALFYLAFYVFDLKPAIHAVADAFKGMLPTSTLGYGG